MKRCFPSIDYCCSGLTGPCEITAVDAGGRGFAKKCQPGASLADALLAQGQIGLTDKAPGAACIDMAVAQQVKELSELRRLRYGGMLHFIKIATPSTLFKLLIPMIARACIGKSDYTYPASALTLYPFGGSMTIS